MLGEDLSELLLPNSVHVVALLGLACVVAFRHRESWLGRGRHLLLALLLWSYCLSTPRAANALSGWLEHACPPAALSGGSDPLIVVLSSGHALKGADGYEPRLDLAGWERTWAAIRLWKQFGGRLLFVGGPIPGGRSSLAEYMGEIARASGVPASAVVVETRSSNTYENLLFNRARLGGKEAWLVTSAVHMKRAMAVARKLALEVRPVPCDYRVMTFVHWYSWLPDRRTPAAFADALHEVLGLMYYRYMGYAS